jgi:class 3 adenylate cyclase
MPPTSPSDLSPRLLTVLAWDIAGSCDLLATLKLATYSQLVRRCQEAAAAAIEAQGGFVARYMGDAVLAYFGFPWPGGQEERAVRAALAVPLRWQQGGILVRSRVAVASGPAIIGAAIGRGAAREFPAFGEPLNLAARLLGVAGPEEVMVDEATSEAVAGRFGFARVGGLSLKGMPQVRHAWRLLPAGNADACAEAA